MSSGADPLVFSIFFYYFFPLTLSLSLQGERELVMQ
jgi:hypothetical protein